MDEDRTCFWLLVTLVLNLINPAVLQQPEVNGTYNATESLESSSSGASMNSDTPISVNTVIPKHLDTEIPSDLDEASAPAVLDQGNVNDTHNATENIEISSPVTVTQMPDTLDSKNLSTSFEPDVLQQPIVNGTYNSTESDEISPPLALTQVTDTSDLEILPNVDVSLDPAALQQPNVNETYNTTENIETSPSVVSAESSDTSTLIISLRPKYLDMAVVSRLRRSIEPDISQESINGTNNSTKILQISLPDASAIGPDTSKLVNSVEPKFIEPEILPGLRRPFGANQAKNTSNLELAVPKEKYLQPIKGNMTYGIPEEVDLQQYNPIYEKDLSIEKIASESSDIKSGEDLLVAPILKNQTTSNLLPLNENVDIINTKQDIFKIPSPSLTYPSESKRQEWPFPISYSVQAPYRLNQSERIMVLTPSKELGSLWNANSVHSRLEQIKLQKWTEDYVLHLHRKYQFMPILNADNRLWSKYSRAVVENFVLAFYKAYLSDTSVLEDAIADFEGSYNKSFDAALRHLQKRKGQTALQFAAQPRRYSDILVAIIDAPMDMVQSNCIPGMATWMCDVKYLTRLMDKSETCSSIWLHALVHLDTIEANVQKNPADIIVDELETRIPIQPSNEVDLLFDFIVNTIEDLGGKLKESLIVNAKLYRDVKELQEKDLLNCLNVN